MSALQNPTPLWRGNATGETSREAAFAVAGKAPTLRERVLAILAEKPAIPETIHARLISEGITTVLTSVRPRCSELMRMGLITDSGRRERGEGGCKAIVWRLTTDEERATFRSRAAASEEERHND